jgi:uncharacterized protein YyaL (SSP411 family)
MNNRLNQQTSPYLLLHKDNPVQWQPWDDEALALARDLDRPILLSIGYSACHWCHVMAEESFDNVETAQTMNELYVNIKVDREERPDLDNIYQSALANMGQQRGWPLTMFLTPGGEPFSGGTYYPPTARQGFPAFKDVLLANAEVYSQDPQQVIQAAKKRLTDLTIGTQVDGIGEISIEFLNHAAAQILDGMDIVYGGFGMDAKFPQTMLLDLLWQAYGRTGHTPFREAVLRSAEHMCLGGIFDHLGGGFARYTIDDRWVIPHFEKMLYDNALIMSLLILVWRETKNPLFSHSIELTANWMIREMKTPEGGFASSVAADSDAYGATEAGEGAYYIWTEAEIDSVLGEQATLFKQYYDVTFTGNWEDGKTILNRIDHPFGRDTELEQVLVQHRQKLFQFRQNRPRPQLDDKILADWNGLAIVALAEAGATFERKDWIEAAVDAYAFIQRKMSSGDSLHHAYRLGRNTPMALLDDYANMAQAAITLYQVSGQISYLDQARRWTEITNEHYWDSAEGGYFFTADNARTIIFRNKTASETATPSGNAMMVKVLAQLYALSSEEVYRQHAEKTIAAFGFEAQSNFVAMASLLNHSELLRNMLQIIVVSDTAGEDKARYFIRTIYEASTAARLVLHITVGTKLPVGHPAFAKNLLNNATTVFVCSGQACQQPTSELGDFETLLETLLLPAP